MNFFDFATAARRYAAGRPYFHPLVVERIRDFTGRDRFPTAIDVCCGTGLSTKALLGTADRIIGSDLSQEMLALAPEDPAISYRCCPAEALEVESNAFDLMTVAMAFHWLDRTHFLAEAFRVLRGGAWLVIYQNGFTGKMRDNPAYATWNHERYLARYPTPPRAHTPLTPEAAVAAGFDFHSTENYSHEVEFTLAELCCYLSTQSNLIAAIEAGTESIDSALGWLAGEIGPMFRQEKEIFPFGGTIWYLQKNSSA